MNCLYCGTECREENEVYICPNHGRVLQEVEESNEEIDRSYIG